MWKLALPHSQGLNLKALVGKWKRGRRFSRMLSTLADELHKSLEKGRRDKNEISTKMR
jgi:hypothetical protein